MRLEYEFERVGVSLDFLPVVLTGGRVSLRIRAEVSDFVLDGSGRMLGGFGQGYVLPPITTRRAQTTVEVPSGGSFMIGGLVKESSRRAVSGFPGLMRLPILGNLFSSKDFQRSETELVIIVTPYIVQPVHPVPVGNADRQSCRCTGCARPVHGSADADLRRRRRDGWQV